jgi:hypothetical protein
MSQFYPPVFCVAKLTPGFGKKTNAVSRASIIRMEQKKALLVKIVIRCGFELLKAIAVTTY